MRLTDEELNEALTTAQSLQSLRLTAAVAELKERRALDLTAEEVEALRFARAVMAGHNPQHHPLGAHALAVLDRLIAGGGK